MTETTIDEQPLEVAEPKKLTVGNLLEDLKKYPPEAEVAVSLHGVNITIPIGYLISAGCATGEKFAIMVVSPASVRKALAYIDQVDKMQKEAQQEVADGEIVN